MKKMDKRKLKALEMARGFCEQILTKWENISCHIVNVSGAWIVIGGVNREKWFNPFYFGVPYREDSGWSDLALRFGARGGKVFVLTSISSGMQHIDEEFRKQLRGKVVLLSQERIAEEYANGLTIIRKLVKH